MSTPLDKYMLQGLWESMPSGQPRTHSTIGTEKMSIHELILNQHVDQVVEHLTLHDAGNGIEAIYLVYKDIAKGRTRTAALASFSGGFKAFRVSNDSGDTTWGLAKSEDEALLYRQEIDGDLEDIYVAEPLNCKLVTDEDFQKYVRGTPLHLFDMAILQAEVMNRQPDADRCFASNWE